MTNFQLAYAAIEAYVVESNRTAHTGGRWLPVIPENEWGMTANGWQAAATRIVQIFNTSIAPRRIQVPDNAKAAFLSKRLTEFRRYLALKADELDVQLKIGKVVQ